MIQHIKKLIISFSVLSMLITITSCQSMPENVTPVSGFNAAQYLGTWYEIARMDFRFEKDMGNVTANYSLNDDGSIRVQNRGFDYIKDEWKEAIGKAKFQDKPTVGALKVSFFGPFYSGYNVIAIDPYYQHALVAGENYDYLWILSRTPTIPYEVQSEYLALADSLGFDTEKLVWVEHDTYVWE